MLLKKRLLKVKYLWAAILLVCTACEPNTVYHSYRSLSTKGWSKNDTLCFRFPVTDSLKSYRLTIELRNEVTYPYQDLYLFIRRFNTKDSVLSVTDTIHCMLADQDGSWKGAGIGGLYQSAYPYADLPVLYTGEYKIEISHGMKDDQLRGIDNLGIKVEMCR